MLRERDALDYHSGGRPGKLEVVPSKSCTSQRGLSLAYTPGVAVPCRAIAVRPDGSVRHPLADKVRRATELVKQRCPGLEPEAPAAGGRGRHPSRWPSRRRWHNRRS